MADSPTNDTDTTPISRQYSQDDIALLQDNNNTTSDTAHNNTTNGYKLDDLYNKHNELIDVESDTQYLQPTKYIQASPLIDSNIHSDTYNTLHDNAKTPKTPNTAHRRNQTTLFGSFQNLVKPFIGAGILALPQAFSRGGVIASTVLMLVLAITVNYCIKKLLICADMIEERNISRYATPSETTNHTPQHKYQYIDTPSNIQYIDVQNDEYDNNENETDTVEHKLHIDTNIKHIDVKPAVTHTPTYRQIGYQAFGHTGSILVDLCLCTSQLGFCIAYVSFISDNMSSMTAGILSRRIWCLLLLPIFALLCQIKSMKTLAPTSIFGNITYAVSIAIIFYDGFSHTAQWVTTDTINYISVSGIPYFFGTACFALEGAGLVLPVRAAMTHKYQFNALLSAGLTTVTICYVVFSILCYIFFGQMTNSVITKNLESGTLTVSVKLCLCISLLFSYAIQMYPVTQMFDQLMDKFIFHYHTAATTQKQQQYEVLSTPVHNGLDSDITVNDELNGNTDKTTDNTAAPSNNTLLQNKRRMTQVSLRIFIVSITVILAIVFPDFGVIVSLIGCLSNSGIAFILPMLFYSKLVIYDNERTDVKEVIQAWCLPVIIILIGISASIAGLTVTIQSIV